MKTIVNQLILFAGIVLWYPVCKAQGGTLERQVLGIAGSIDDQVSWNIGEGFVTTVTNATETRFLLQGFEQPLDTDAVVTGLGEYQGQWFTWRLFPNPTQGLVTLEVEDLTQYSIVWTNLNGQQIQVPGELQRTVVGNQHSWNLAHLPEGVYLLSIVTELGKTVKTFRVQRQ